MTKPAALVPSSQSGPTPREEVRPLLTSKGRIGRGTPSGRKREKPEQASHESKVPGYTGESGTPEESELYTGGGYIGLVGGGVLGGGVWGTGSGGMCGVRRGLVGGSLFPWFPRLSRPGR